MIATVFFGEKLTPEQHHDGAIRSRMMQENVDALSTILDVEVLHTMEMITCVKVSAPISSIMEIESRNGWRVIRESLSSPVHSDKRP